MHNQFTRWGSFVTRHAWAVLFIALVLLATGIVGIARITVANGTQQIFVSGSEAYARYEAMRVLFPPSQTDAILVISDPEVLTPSRLEALRDLHFDLSLQDGVVSVVSPLSAYRAADDGETFTPVVPGDIPSGDAFDAVVAELVAHPLVRDRLVSADAQTVLFNIGLDPARIDGAALQKLVAALRKTADADLAPAGLTALMTGEPVMRAELDAINAYEQLMLSLGGFIVGALVSLAYFRRFSFALMSGTVPAATLVATFGLLGWIGIQLTLALQIVGPLVTVIAFNNAMHMLFAILHGRHRGVDGPTRVARAVADVGPASLMTSLTSALAFTALTLTDSQVIRAFGALAAFGTMASFIAVITIIPALAALVMRWHAATFEAEDRPEGGHLGAACVALDRRAGRHARAIVGLGGILFVVFALAQTTLSPRYLMSDNMPFHSETRAAIGAIDTSFGGSQPLRILVRWPANDAAAEAALVGHLHDLEVRLAAHPSIGSVVSLATWTDWLAIAHPGSARDLDSILEASPDKLSGVLIDRDGGAALVTAMVPDQSTGENRQLIAEISDMFDEISPGAPGFSFEVTGIVALTALEAGRIIGSLQLSLLAAIVLIIGLIGVTFRRLWPAAISILPNLFPIVAGGAFLAARGGELNFAGAIAMTVAFGLAVDDTIHMLYRFRREQARGASVELALERTIAKIGPVLVVSSLVLIAGIAVLLLSQMPMNRDYALLTIIIFVAALVGDLILLPALIRVFRSRLSNGADPLTPRAGER